MPQFGKTIHLTVETLPDARSFRIVPVFPVFHGIFQIEQVFGKEPETDGGKKFMPRIDGMDQSLFQSLRNSVLDRPGKPEPERDPLLFHIGGPDHGMDQRFPSALRKKAVYEIRSSALAEQVLP